MTMRGRFEDRALDAWIRQSLNSESDTAVQDSLPAEWLALLDTIEPSKR